jgi:hypothetical protein
LHYFWKLNPDRIRIEVKSWIRIRIKAKIQKLSRRAVDAHKEAWRLKMEPWRIYRPLIADSHHSDEEQDAALDQHLSEKLDPDLH